jgi:transposase
MIKPLCEDLRGRVIDAVEGGMSRRAAAERFGVSVSSAVRWVKCWRETGLPGPRPRGGDKRSQRIEAYKDEILAAVEAKADMTLVEIAEFLRSFLDRHAMTVKKTRARQQAGPTRRGTGGGWPGSTPSLISTRRSSSSSTRPARRPRWPGAMAAQSAEPLAARRSLMAIARRQPSLPDCASPASRRPWSSTAR